MDASLLPLRVQCGQLVVGGFPGTELSPTFRAALARGERGGAILFRRNIAPGAAGLVKLSALNQAMKDAAPSALPPLIGVDQEGGRVTRLGPPFFRLPTMRTLGRVGDRELVHTVAEALGHELAALGFTMNFAPVLDVDSCAENPIIGDRSFHGDPDRVRELGHAFASGLQSGGVLACGKHFPGHGDTTVDSHKDLPYVRRSRASIDGVELIPFRGLRADTCAALMSAHVVYEALDRANPATLSQRIARDLLRDELQYDGLLVSDDLEMKAIADRMSIEEAATRAVFAGCDVLLICSSEVLQDRAVDALVRRAERDPAFRAGVTLAAARGIGARRRCTPRPLHGAALVSAIGSPRSRLVAERLEACGALP